MINKENNVIFNKTINKHQQFLKELPKIPQNIEDIKILHNPKEFYQTLLHSIITATQHIFLVVLYLEQDQGGHKILETIFQTKQKKPEIKIAILVDWHRAQRGRLGVTTNYTNIEWYRYMSKTHPDIDVPIYGVPIHNREALGVLHLKGFIIDDLVIYSGASFNNTYLHQKEKYRYDRYHLIKNKILADIMLNYIKKYLLTADAVNRLDKNNKLNILKIKKKIKLFRQSLKKSSYICYNTNAKYTNTKNELTITPLVGLGKQNNLNKTIQHLICATEIKLILCTPYFNLPTSLIQNLIQLLHQNKQIEIIVGDKTTNDFFIPEDQPFKIIGILPYLYEINLKNFINKFQNHINTGQMQIKIWKDNNNSFHLKGIWIDDKYQLLTGSNLNPRAWRLDLENALLIHDPQNKLKQQKTYELNNIQLHTKIINHYNSLQNITDYPTKIRKLILRLRRTYFDRIINKIL
ncbi:CDP-diacylglycerol--serine O-phosphatidyltransferase [Blochmannia endosymbiont of Camponotus (Colobopsis) obliquus]|uniref:CDP-diacylglycerol--serine O-phosphatidyltransferase n=1 Tax=Blochmannia endosymbiont of Camponotus (Colobopsis) obliquus TaxID=1505597 RepID=UPI00061A6E3E|nr:CDP-diacylglycerol--serine O-phosphatidyltransferase [Blochmannia endosymbiont of Camponotus (Colobopsis) obliquus]AKC60698.1 CDP-diacylglycerol--serine O-phosphatidyltransferase [Blochmannia endosymbiont of Camponotus (Colobopsis) obliquus]